MVKVLKFRAEVENIVRTCAILDTFSAQLSTSRKLINLIDDFNSANQDSYFVTKDQLYIFRGAGSKMSNYARLYNKHRIQPGQSNPAFYFIILSLAHKESRMWSFGQLTNSHRPTFGKRGSFSNKGVGGGG